MNLTTENILLIGSVLLMISIIAGKTSFRFGVPVILFFVLTGMLAGSEGIGGINFNDPAVARFVGFVALNFILFSGGFETRIEVIRNIIWKGLTLATLGVLLTAFSVGVFLWAFTDFNIYEGLLLGSIVSSTDAAAVFSVLRSRNMGLTKDLRATLELESGSNDPMAYFLTIAFTGLIMGNVPSAIDILPLFVKQMIIGAVMGLLIGKLGKEIINRIKLDFEGLYPVLVIALMFFTSSFTDFIGGNGFLAVYLAAVYLGNQNLIHKKTIVQVFDGLAWLMQIILFLTLGLLVFPSQILPVLGTGLIVSAFMILVARPLSVFITLLPFKLDLRSTSFISWVGLRGAVPIVFATYPLLAGVEKSDMIFNIVFFVSLSSVLIQGTTIPFMARLLNVAAPENERVETAREIEFAEAVKNNLAEVQIKSGCFAIGKRIVDTGFPSTAKIAIINRNGRYIVPEGATVIAEGDILMILAENEQSLEQVRNCIFGTHPNSDDVAL